MDFESVLQVDLGVIKRQLPLRNSFGPVLPSLHDESLISLLKISPQDVVLDIGGGSAPFSRANVVTEPYLDDSAHRSGRKVRADVDYVECFAEKLPFPDRSFDFAISRQVFEHVSSPADACREIMRVARRGFIETPQKKFEILLGANPSHNWFVSVVDGTLVFERRRFIRHPFRNLIMSAVPSTVEGQYLMHFEFKNMTNVQFYWEGGFKYEVIEQADGFNYENTDHAAEAHLDVALCGLLHGGFYLNQRESDAVTAVRLRPKWALARNTLGLIYWYQGKYEEAGREFIEAAQLENREEYKLNSSLVPGDGQVPIIVDFEDTLPMDEAFFEEIRRPGGVDIFKLLA